MIDPNYELERLKDILRSKGLSEQEIDRTSNEAAQDISFAITDALAGALSEAAQAGIDEGALKFVDELKAVRVGNYFEIGTDSGQMQFREPPFPMIPSLLKNAKMSKDGTLYKHIPMGKDPGRKSTTSLMNAQKNISAAQNEAKANWGTGKKDVMETAMQFSGTYTAAKASSRNDEMRAKVLDKNPHTNTKFRTVTNKQDSSTQWVRPAKNNDVAGTVNDINNRLKESIDSAVISIIQKYGEGF